MDEVLKRLAKMEFENHDLKKTRVSASWRQRPKTTTANSTPTRAATTAAKPSAATTSSTLCQH